MTGYLLGIDAGHTLIKAVVFNTHGRSVGSATRTTKTICRYPRWQERDMDTLWDSTAAAIADALADAGIPPAAVLGVGISAHGDGLYLVDALGRPVRPAILATDSRASNYCSRWADPAIAKRLLAVAGQLPAPYSPPATLSWLRDNEPAVLPATRYLLHCKDWLRLRLTGAVATDPTDAAAGLADITTRQWSPELLDLYGLTDIRRILPLIVPSSETAGRVTPDAAAVTGLAAGTPVITGSHDVHAAALGIGALREGAVSCVLGTFNINQIATPRAVTSTNWQARSSIPDDLYLLMATSPAGATAMDWVRTITGLDAEPLGAAVTAALTTPITNSDPFFLPFVHGSNLSPSIGGAFIDLGGWQRPLDLLRAGLEGVVFTHRLHLQHLASADRHLPDRAIRLTGGGSRSIEWSQLMADVTGRRIDVTDTHEAGARGAAMLTGIATGVFQDLEDASRRCVTVIRQHHPNPDRQSLMNARFTKWTAFIAALQETVASDIHRA